MLDCAPILQTKGTDAQICLPRCRAALAAAAAALGAGTAAAAGSQRAAGSAAAGAANGSTDGGYRKQDAAFARNVGQAVVDWILERLSDYHSRSGGVAGAMRLKAHAGLFPGRRTLFAVNGEGGPWGGKMQGHVLCVLPLLRQPCVLVSTQGDDERTHALWLLDAGWMLSGGLRAFQVSWTCWHLLLAAGVLQRKR